MFVPTRTKRLLVVDDEAELLDAVCDALRDAGFEVTGCADAAGALAALGDGFDLLLSDLMMPGMSGTALLRQARRVEPGLVGVIMTGQGSSQAESEARAAGAVDLLRKPFRMRQVLSVLERALAVAGGGEVGHPC
jgi:DNA-binding NtrC family response regulator